ncbi:MAG: arsenate reductase ArsC [Nitrospinae bacterium]|nr:arsenate reductase ArsC [Nitrospinota bacterium]
MRHILVLCTGNSARSILAEAVLNRDGAGRVRAYSAGSRPTGRVNPGAVRLLERLGLPTEGYRSKSWDEFAAPGAPKMDLVVTVCDSAAGEICPVWPGAPLTAHWGVDDPAAAPEDQIDRAFRVAYHRLSARINAFLALDFEDMDRAALMTRLDAIARI